VRRPIVDAAARIFKRLAGLAPTGQRDTAAILCATGVIRRRLGMAETFNLAGRPLQ
jgi:hypothetical protein